MSSMDQIFKKYGTDKSASTHNYSEAYQELFESLRSKEISLLEVGVYKGESLASWCDYFPNGKIVGADIDLQQMRPELVKKLSSTGRCFLEEGDITSPEVLAGLSRHQPFDIIIDDGSHFSRDVIAAFESLFYDFLKEGGYYVIEDMSCSYTKPGFIRKVLNKLVGKEPRSRRRKAVVWLGRTLNIKNIDYVGRHEEREMVDYFKRIVDDVNFNGKNIRTIEQIQSYLGSNKNKREKYVEWIQFRNQLVIIKKRSLPKLI